MTKLDPLIQQREASCFGSKHILLNMDFAFGAQAEGITRTLILTFGKCIRSFNIMGKAGGLVGKRGDIQLASNVLLSKSSSVTGDTVDELRSCGNQDLTKKRLEELAGPAVAIHTGNVLTIPGTMLQNVRLLKYYRTIWRCVGLEMEGSYFARCIYEGRRSNLVRNDLVSRFAYYTSDLPLAVSSDTNLAAPLKPNEGIPPLYAIARSILELILAAKSCDYSRRPSNKLRRLTSKPGHSDPSRLEASLSSDPA